MIARPSVRELAGRHDLLALAAAHPQRYPGLLESAAPGPLTARFDILLAFPDQVIEARRADDGFFERLDAAWSAERIEPGYCDLPFSGGWLLFLSYELAGACEPRLRLPPAPVEMPLALALRCKAAVIYDHDRDLTVLMAEEGSEALLQAMHDDLGTATSVAPAPPLAGAVLEDDEAQFIAGVARIKQYLVEGDVFQVNLSRGWNARLPATTSAAALYARLRQTNPAPFAGLFQWRDDAVISSSPERLVKVCDGRVETRPIAGTRPRLAGDNDDERVRELVGHPKERAEHIMLIDLERNDLGRICVPGSVAVDELMTVESYTHVHHIVSNVGGRLREGVTPGDTIRAVFPGGTITGCPKVRCMEIIAELEGTGRGPYTGALGYLNRDGSMDLNILIRTVWLNGGIARLRAGSGIVADSQAERELDETRAKARGMLRALTAQP